LRRLVAEGPLSGDAQQQTALAPQVCMRPPRDGEQVDIRRAKFPDAEAFGDSHVYGKPATNA